MGAIWAKFRKKKTAIEELEEIEKKTKSIEEYRRDSQQRQKRYIGVLILYSIILYIICCIIFYFYYFPALWTDRIFHSLPLLLFPFLVWCIKRLLQAYFRHRISQSEEQLGTIRRRKKKILEEVMDKEKYKVAKEILEKFDPSVKEEKEKAAQAALAQENMLSLRANTEMRQRLMSGRGASGPNRQFPPPPPVAGRGIGRGYPSTSSQMQSIGPGRPPGPPMPRPILPRERNTVDRLIEYIVGDGPNNRLALICKRCFSHNGMALKEEFDYLTYRCCYCHTINPARKQRPSAPKLLLESSPEISETQGDSEEGSEEDELPELQNSNNTIVLESQHIKVKETGERNDDNKQTEIDENNIETTEEGDIAELQIDSSMRVACERSTIMESTDLSEEEQQLLEEK